MSYCAINGASFPSSAWERMSGKLCFPRSGRGLDKVVAGMRSGASRRCVPKRSLGTRGMATLRDFAGQSALAFLDDAPGIGRHNLGIDIFRQFAHGDDLKVVVRQVL